MEWEEREEKGKEGKRMEWKRKERKERQGKGKGVRTAT